MSKRENGYRGYDTKGTDIGSGPTGEIRQVLKEGHRVALIGGGNCGVYSLKALREMGVNATLYEQSHTGVGGVWRDRGYNGVAYTSLRTNSSVVTTSAPAFPFQFKPSTPFPHHTEVLKYVNQYCDHFKLWDGIQLGTKALQVAPVDESNIYTKWNVTFSKTKQDFNPTSRSSGFPPPEGDSWTEQFDAVLTCAGQYGGVPFTPKNPGIENFKGTVLHSKDWLNNKVVEGKRVLVVGIGNSALDIALDCCWKAEKVLISSRNGAGIMSVVDPKGNPVDTSLLSRHSQGSASPQLGKAAFATDLHQTFLKNGMPKPNSDLAKVAAGMVKDVKSFLKFLEEKKMILGAGLKTITPTGVILSNGQSHDIDVIIYCTGYDTVASYSFIDKDVLGTTVKVTPSGKQFNSLYKMCLHPKYYTLGMCGLITSNANEGLIGELQARWVANMLLGKSKFPTDSEVESYCSDRETMITQLDPAYPRFIRYLPYMDSLASEIGCLPDIKSPGKVPRFPPSPPKDPVALYHYNLYYGPATAVQWRLKGPNSWEDKKTAELYVTENLTPGFWLPKRQSDIGWGSKL